MEQSPVTLSIKGTADQVAIVWVGMLRAFAEAADMVDRPAWSEATSCPWSVRHAAVARNRPSPQKEEPP